MVVFQKKDPDQSPSLVSPFDGLISEQCNQYSECSKYHAYLTAGKPVLDAEYKNNLYPGFCSTEPAGIMGALFNTALNGRVFKPCW